MNEKVRHRESHFKVIFGPKSSFLVQNRLNFRPENTFSGYKSKKLLKMTMPNPSDLRQSLLAFFMILFFGSTMSLVWTFTVIVPFIKGTNYGNGSCSLAGINGVPPVCRNHTYFNKINLFTNNGVSKLKFWWQKFWWRHIWWQKFWCWHIFRNGAKKMNSATKWFLNRIVSNFMSSQMTSFLFFTRMRSI